MRRSFFLVSLIQLSLSAHALELDGGLWQLQVKQEITGMAVDRAPMRIEQCLSREDPIPTAYLQARRCDVLERKEKYGKLHWRMSCFTEHGTVVNKGFVRFRGRRMSGRSQSDFGDVQRRRMTIRYEFSGVRVGECSNR